MKLSTLLFSVIYFEEGNCKSDVKNPKVSWVDEVVKNYRYQFCILFTNMLVLAYWNELASKMTVPEYPSTKI